MAQSCYQVVAKLTLSCYQGKAKLWFVRLLRSCQKAVAQSILAAMTSTTSSSSRVRIKSFRSQEQKLKWYSFIWLTALRGQRRLLLVKLWTHERLWYWINQVDHLHGSSYLVKFEHLFNFWSIIYHQFSFLVLKTNKLGSQACPPIHFTRFASLLLPSFWHLPPLPLKH